MNFPSLCLLVSLCSTFDVRSQTQPECPHFRHVSRFYENHSKNRELPSMCKDPFHELLDSCVRLYQKTRLKKVEAKRSIARDEETVVKRCEKHKMVFWQMDNSTGPESRTNVTLDVHMFRCPLKNMDLKYVNGSTDPKLEEFYITEGVDRLTVAVLRNSTSSGNICMTNLFKYNVSRWVKDITSSLGKEWTDLIMNNTKPV